MSILLGRARSRARHEDVLFLGWTDHLGRLQEFAEVFDGRVAAVFPQRLGAADSKPIRYVLSALETVALLARRRPAAVVCINPPIFGALIAILMRPLLGHNVVIDSHPGGFGAQGDTWSARMQWAHRWAAKRASAVLVASEPWLDIVSSWGGHGIVAHEAPSSWTVGASRGQERMLVLFIGRFAPDEPVDELIEAARLTPQLDLMITGDPNKAEPGLLANLPSNVTLTGYLGQAQYRSAIESADLVMTLTTEPTSVPRSGCEAVYAQRPLLLSDSPATRSAFPHAIHVGNTSQDIARGWVEAEKRLPELRAQAPISRAEQLAAWDNQVAQVSRAIRGNAIEDKTPKEGA